MPISVLNVDAARQITPLWLYRRVQVAGPVENISFPVSYGYHYNLNRVFSKWPDRNATPVTIAYPQVQWELTDQTRSIPHQNVAYPLRLISTPAEPGVVVAPAPAPVDATAFNVNMTATGPRVTPYLGILFPYRGVIQIRLTGFQFLVAAWRPEFVDILLDGDLVPNEELDLWG